MGAKSRLQKQLIGICLISLFTCVLCFWLYIVLACTFLQPLAITGMTVFFHLAARLLIGTIFEKIYHNQMHFCRPWFRPKPWEARLYKALRVKQWKKYMPTFSPETFAFDKQRLHSILGATCQAEMVHLCSVAVSFVPLLFAKWFGAFAVFAITSVLAGAFDSAFVILQRYNRARMWNLLNKLQAKENAQ